MRGNSESVISHGEIEDLDNLVGDAMNVSDDDLETSHSSNSAGGGSGAHSHDSTNTGNYQQNRCVLTDPLNHSDDEKEFQKINVNNNDAPNGHARQAAVDMILDTIDPEVDGTGARTPQSDDEGCYSDSGWRSGASTTMRETQPFFTIANEILTNTENHTFPWTVWIMQRDNMSHIGGSRANENQIRAVLEFVYLFARGCLNALQEHWRNTLSLTSLYHNTVDGSDSDSSSEEKQQSQQQHSNRNRNKNSNRNSDQSLNDFVDLFNGMIMVYLHLHVFLHLEMVDFNRIDTAVSPIDILVSIFGVVCAEYDNTNEISFGMQYFYCFRILIFDVFFFACLSLGELKPPHRY